MIRSPRYGPQGSLLRPTPLVQFSVYLKPQNPLADVAPHRTSRTFALRLVSDAWARKVGQNAIQLLTKESFKSLKSRYQGRRSSDAVVLPVRNWQECLLLSYPLPDQRTVAV